MPPQNFEQALKPHFNDAANYFRALCASWKAVAADDVFQDALLRALRFYPGVQDREKFKAWLFRIITNTFHNHARRQVWRRFIPFDFAAEENDFPAVFGAAAYSPETLRLYRGLARLNPAERTALLLFEVAGFSAAEVQAIQGERSLSAIKSRLSRAREKVRENMEEDAPQPALETGRIGNLTEETFRLIPRTGLNDTNDKEPA